MSRETHADVIAFIKSAYRDDLGEPFTNLLPHRLLLYPVVHLLPKPAFDATVSASEPWGFVALPFPEAEKAEYTPVDGGGYREYVRLVLGVPEHLLVTRGFDLMTYVSREDYAIVGSSNELRINRIRGISEAIGAAPRLAADLNEAEKYGDDVSWGPRLLRHLGGS